VVGSPRRRGGRDAHDWEALDLVSFHEPGAVFGSGFSLSFFSLFFLKKLNTFELVRIRLLVWLVLSRWDTGMDG
jgi:hypothetical protein